MDVMEKFRSALKAIIDSKTHMDSGGGMGMMNFWPTIDGVEYFVEIRQSAKRQKIKCP